MSHVFTGLTVGVDFVGRTRWHIVCPYIYICIFLEIAFDGPTSCHLNIKVIVSHSILDWDCCLKYFLVNTRSTFRFGRTNRFDMIC